MEDFNKIHLQLSEMLQKVKENQGFKKFLKKTSQKLNFEKNNFLNLSTEKVQSMHLNFKQKITSIKHLSDQLRQIQSSSWLQNQLRMFIYITCTHLYLKKITIFDLKQQDYDYLSQFFPLKRRQHLQYQIKLLTFNKNIKWTIEESRLFEELMRKFKDLKRWNHIAKELFILSKKKYFKTPKQCRQRWINHVDPSKIKGNWSQEQDLILLNSVIKFGKKWTLISNELNNTRTQNSVKNRYNSLIKIAKKQFGFDKSEQKLTNLLTENISKTSNLHVPSQQIQTPIQGINIEEKNDKKNIEIIKSETEQNQEKITKNQCSVQLKSLNQKKINLNDKDQQFSTNFQIQKFSYQPKYILDESQEIQNIAWNHSSNHAMQPQHFYLLNGSLQFDDHLTI